MSNTTFVTLQVTDFNFGKLDTLETTTKSASTLVVNWKPSIQLQ